jgi:hypothetical protein
VARNNGWHSQVPCQQQFENEYSDQLYYLVYDLHFDPARTIVIEYPRWLIMFYQSLSDIIRIVMVLCFLYCLVLLLSRKMTALLAVTLYILISSLVTVAVLHTFDNRRYIDSMVFLIQAYIFFCFLNMADRILSHITSHLPKIIKPRRNGV